MRFCGSGCAAAISVLGVAAEGSGTRAEGRERERESGSRFMSHNSYFLTKHDMERERNCLQEKRQAAERDDQEDVFACS